PNSVTQLWGINNKGQIVGSYFTFDPATNETFPHQGFIYDNGNFFPLDFPGFDQTIPVDINNNGQIVGMLYPANQIPLFGFFGGDIFFFDDGEFFLISKPEPKDPNGSVGRSTLVTGINDRAEIVGEYSEFVPSPLPPPSFGTSTRHVFIGNPAEIRLV